jgi:uncharacterized protein
MIRRFGLALLAALLLGIVTSTTASAHVRVSSTDASRGGYGLLTFRVPTESDTASTTAVIIDFPTDTPLTSVSVLPVTGWTATRTIRKLPHPEKTDDGAVDSYVARLTWKADSARFAIKPGEFGLFAITAGPLPDRASIAFPTTQRYSDGSTVAWDQIATGQGAEPEHPAPVVQLPAAASGATTGPASPATARSSADAASGAAGGPNGLSVAALVLAGVAVIAAVIALFRTRRPA